MKKFIIGLNAIVVLFFFTLPVHAGPALATVQTQVDKILDVLRDPTLKAESAKETKEEKVLAIINEVFDYTELSKRTLSRNWKKLNPDQREEFKDLFSKLLGGQLCLPRERMRTSPQLRRQCLRRGPWPRLRQ